MREELPGVGHQDLEQSVLGRGEMQGRVAARHQPAGEVHRQVAEAQDGRGRLLAPATPERGAGACQQLLHAERLRDEVVGPCVERRDLVVLPLPHGYDDDRHLAERAYPLDDLGTVDIGQAEIEQDQVRRHLRRAEHPFLAGAYRLDLVAVRLEAGAERAADLWFVVDDQHLHSDPIFTGSSNTTTVPPAGSSFDPDPTAVRDHDRLRDGQSETAARPLRRGVASIERLEHALTFGLGDAVPLVRDPHLDRVAERGGGHLYLATSGRVGRGVLEQVRQDLVDLHRIDEHLGEVGPHVQSHDDAGQARPHPGDRRVDDLVDRRGLARRDQGARPDLGQVHQVADQPVHPVGLLQDRRQEFASLRRIVRQRHRRASSRPPP